MSNIDFNYILTKMINQEVDRPNKSSSGTLSGHAAGEPFEKL
ncbi:MAG: HincII family type II restriction endonuclease, partial [Muribaculaceae bacterium]|nr:HincII family type II restriction endonuclease [Muribaculaceae bacterium]